MRKYMFLLGALSLSAVACGGTEGTEPATNAAGVGAQTPVAPPADSGIANAALPQMSPPAPPQPPAALPQPPAALPQPAVAPPEPPAALPEPPAAPPEPPAMEEPEVMQEPLPPPAPANGACAVPAELVGWATENGGVTGGCGGPEVTVASKDELEAAAGGTDKKIIKISGTLSGSGMMDIGSNKTLIGMGSDATITGFGLNMNSQTNIIIQNISFTKANDDSVNIQNESTQIWIDHCDFSSGSDGLLDIKRGSDFITVSYNRFSKHHKTCLLGHNDGNGAQDIGHLRVSYHHNFFDGSNTRNPRIRFGHAHVFNNYYKSVSGYGVAGVKDSHVLVEGNYFENTKSPTFTKYGNSSSGNVNERMNVYDGSGNPQTRGDVPEFPYEYDLDNPEDIPTIVENGAGVGKL